MKIVVTQDLGLSQCERNRLNKLGDVTYYENLADNYDEWLERVRGAGVICTGKFGLKQRHGELHDVFLSLPFVGIGFLDFDTLKRNNVTVANCPGCNSIAVSEYIVAMILNLFRDLPRTINDLEPITNREPTIGLANKNITILGHGNIGSRVGKVCDALDMNVCFFRRGDDLHESVKNADIVVDALAQNPSTAGLLNKQFFDSLKGGAYFITVTSAKIWDYKALLAALDSGRLAGAACDCGSIQTRDTSDPLYVELAKHPKVLATPHIAYNTNVTDRVSNQMMIDSIVAYKSGKLINIVDHN